MADVQDVVPALPELTERNSYAYAAEKDDLSPAEKPSSVVEGGDSDALGESLYVKGQPVVQDGKDVSRFIVDLRDDGDPPLTFRSLLLGCVFGALGAAIYQIYQFKPTSVTVSGVFLLLIIWVFGVAWAKAFPRAEWVEGTRFASFARVLHFINPGEFRIKEHVVSAIMASTAANGSTAVMNFAVQRLYYDTHVNAATAILATFSTAVFGYSIVGLLRPLTVWPSEMVYWANLPTVAVFQSLHYNTENNQKRKRLFWIAFLGMFVYEVFPAYIFPLLNGFSIVCLATQHASPNTQNIVTNIFGGAWANEGLGLLNFSFDWQYITSYYVSVPLIQQANTWLGLSVCYIALSAIYYSNTWNSLSFPMLSTSIFNQNGTVYHQKAVFTGPNFSLNQTALEEIGLPALTGSNAWANLTANLAIGGLIAHCFVFWGPYVWKSFKQARDKTQPDPHWQAMQRYKECPHWWYLVLMVLSFFAGLIAVLKGDTSLPVWSYIVALISGAIVTPFSTLLYARMGNGIATNQLFKMIAGATNPGRPVANLYFSMWSHDVVSQSINLAQDLKAGQYLKIPARVMFLTQLLGTIVGAVVNYVVMISIVTSEREILLDPIGNNVWSGQSVQSLNTNAITWALAKDLYGPHGAYFIIPMSLFIGAAATVVQWLICKRWPKIGPVHVQTIMLPIIYQGSSQLSVGVNSPVLSGVIVGIVSQFWLRRRHPRWYNKYNYLLGGALDGGSQVMVFILSFAVFGAAGVSNPFPSWAGNPGNNIPSDYCNGNQN